MVLQISRFVVIFMFMTSIRKYRKLAGLTQSELALAAGVGRQSRIANYETGYRNASISDLRKIRDALLARGIECSIDSLIASPDCGPGQVA